jgi:hypothetical protein
MQVGINMQARVSLAFATLLLATVASVPARAEDLIPGGEEQFKISAGGILAWINSGIGVDGSSNNGTVIDLESPNGSKSANNFVLGAEWRVASRHRVGAIFFTTSKDRTLSFDQSVTIGDETLVPPTTLASTSRNRFVFATYEYSFVKNKDVELSGLLGAYVNKFSADLTGTATVQNSNGQTTINKSVSYTPSVTVPMPLIGGSVDWFVSPRITLGASLSGLKAKIGDVNGSVFVATASAEYMFTRNLGAGLAFMHTSADVDVTKSNFTGSVDWRNDNLLLYAALKF